METTEQDAAEAVVSLPALHESSLPNEHALYRPRHGKHQVTALVSATIFFCVPLLLLILGVRPEVIENRKSAGFPSPADGWGFFTGLDQWATDATPLRATAVRVEDWISRNVFAEPPSLGEKQRDRGPIQEPPTTPPPDTRNPERQIEGFPKVIEGRDGWYYLGYDVQGACRPDIPLAEVVASLQRLRSIVESSGRKFVFVMAPDKTTMVPEHLPANYVGADCAPTATAALWQRMIRDVGAIDLRPVLQSVVDQTHEPIYSAVDTHWDFTGGLVMATAIAEQIQSNVTATWRISSGEEVTRAGDLPPLIGHKGNYKLRYYDLAPDGDLIRSRRIEDDIHTTLELSQPVTTGVVGPSVGMMADSFTEPALPYLAGGFSNVTVMHTDTVRANPQETAKVLASKDVVVFEAVQRSLAGGTNALLTKDVLDAIQAELSAHPRR